MTNLPTSRELQIAGLVMRGMKYRKIARKLGITEGSVKAHIYKLRQKPLGKELTTKYK